MKRWWIRLILITVAVLLVPAALAAAAPTNMTLAASPGMKGLVQLEARLTGADGKPLGEQTVSFRLGTVFFGERSVFLGEEVTDSAGVATFLYQPNQNGQHQFVARYAGNDSLAQGEVKVAYAVTTVAAAAAHADSASALGPIWRMTGAGAVVLTAVIWAILILTLVRVRTGIGRIGSRPQFQPLPGMVPSSTKGD